MRDYARGRASAKAANRVGGRLALLLLFAGLALSAATASAKTYFIHPDHLGTPQVITDSTQAVVWRATYDAFGKATVTVGSVENNLRFPGQYYDAESGLHYNYFRDYDPEIGRYLQSDPIGLEGGLNTYAYAANNPLRFVDPTGELFFIPAIFGGLVGGGTSAGTATIATAGVVTAAAAVVASNSSIDWPPNLPKPIDPWTGTTTTEAQICPAPGKPPAPERERCVNSVELRYAACRQRGRNPALCHTERVIGLLLCGTERGDGD